MRSFFDATRQMFDTIAFTRETVAHGATFLDWVAVYRGAPMTGITLLEAHQHGRLERVQIFYGPIQQIKLFSDELNARLAP